MIAHMAHRTPNDTTYGTQNHAKLRDVLNEMSHKHYLLMGDFNYPDIDWSNANCLSENSQLFRDCLDDNFLVRHVRSPTRKDNILDLVITEECDMVDNVIILEHLTNSDHNIL